MTDLADLGGGGGACGFLSFEKGETCQINLNYVARENSLKLTWSKKESVVCEALFYLK